MTVPGRLVRRAGTRGRETPPWQGGRRAEPPASAQAAEPAKGTRRNRGSAFSSGCLTGPGAALETPREQSDVTSLPSAAV